MGIAPFTFYLYYVKWVTSGYVSYYETMNQQTYQRKYTYTAKNPYAEKNEAFQVLGIQPTNDKIAIKNAYRKLALSFHPDIYNGGNEKFIEIQTAYEIIMKNII